MESVADEPPTATEARPAANKAVRGTATWPTPVHTTSTTAAPRLAKRRRSRDSRTRRRPSAAPTTGSSFEGTQSESQSKSHRQRRLAKKSAEASAVAGVAGDDAQRVPAAATALTSVAQAQLPAAPPAAPVGPAARGATASTATAPAAHADQRGAIGAALPAAPPAAPVEDAAAPAQPAAVPATGKRNAQQEKILSFVAGIMIVVAAGIALASIVAAMLAPADESASGCPPLEKTLKDDTVVVATSVGRLIGRRVTVNGVLLSRFLGVPFAESTAGQRRFAQPVLLHTPCEVREALVLREPCTQWYNGNVSGSEDCLHVNVWAPALPPGPADAKRALAVVITGEWFENGSNSDRDWSDLAAAGRLVVVAPNHRQGVLGFLRSTDVGAGVTPDVALEDVRSAVAWARGNAAAFDADATRLVFVGRGSGAYMLSAAELNMTSGTVLRAVYHGIVLGSLLPNHPEGGGAYSRLSSQVNCTGIKDAAAWVRCLRAVSANDLIEASLALPLGFAPETNVATTVAGASTPSHAVIAGSDTAAVAALFEERLLPLAPRGVNKTVQELWDYALSTFSAASRNRRDFQRGSMDDLFTLLHHLVSACPMRRWALAGPEGYHYMAGSSELFDPPLNLSSLARFAAEGTVPTLANGTAWPSLRNSLFTRVITGNGQQLTDINKYCEHTEVVYLKAT
ncbi:hypothetical protein HPB48_021544 [Haemaphysalis longicornis]|uniref:Carboxylesterase type B domain-containing protein n=1 Tax=Haemaphysalis longicornis TaxID=44386 RepID=A0A9J6GEX9_HAELO|nr:hypothetical protein HPB48_021544 [Haemaphysalis longicornis]